MLERNNSKFEILKVKVLETFEKYSVDLKTIELIKSKTSLLKLQNFLSSSKKEHRDILEKEKIEYRRKKITKKKSSKFSIYKFKIINTLVHNSNLHFEKQQKIYDINNRKLLLEYLEKNLSNEEKRILKNSKIKPFYKGNTFTKILYNLMGNKR